MHFISAESESMDMKLMELKIWNGTHTNNVSFKRTNSEVKLMTLHFNDIKNVEARYEAIEYIHEMDNFTVVNEKQNVKDYLLASTVDCMRLPIAVEQ